MASRLYKLPSYDIIEIQRTIPDSPASSSRGAGSYYRNVAPTEFGQRPPSYPVTDIFGNPVRDDIGNSFMPSGGSSNNSNTNTNKNTNTGGGSNDGPPSDLSSLLELLHRLGVDGIQI